MRPFKPIWKFVIRKLPVVLGIHAFILLSIGCLNLGPFDTGNKEAVLKNTSFDWQVMQRIKKYEAIKDLLIKNLTKVIFYKRGNKHDISIGIEIPDSTHIGNQIYSQEFSIARNSGEIGTMPNSLHPAIDKLIDDLGPVYEEKLNISTDSNVIFMLKYEYPAQGIVLLHKLVWNIPRNAEKGYGLYKDTVLNGDCIYRIQVLNHPGW